jgi:hypothetical protein
LQAFARGLNAIFANYRIFIAVFCFYFVESLPQTASFVVAATGVSKSRTDLAAARAARQPQVKTSILLSVLTIAACTSSPPTMQELAAGEYQRVNSRIETVEGFGQRREKCVRSGGTFHVTRSSSGRLPPTVNEMRTATCH